MVYCASLYRVLVEYERQDLSEKEWETIEEWLQIEAWSADDARQKAWEIVCDDPYAIVRHDDDSEVWIKKVVELPQSFYMTMVGAPRRFELEAV